MFQYRWFNGAALPPQREGLLKAGANIGAVVGQFLFGYLADAFGRKAVYGKELMIIIFATILTLCVPSGIGGLNVLTWVTVCRVILGIGIGGDYPMSASVSSDRATLKRRGTMLAYIFSAQGWGSLVGSIVTVVVLAIYKHSMNDLGHTSKVDGGALTSSFSFPLAFTDMFFFSVWRIVVGLSLIPAFGTLYQRLTLPEATKYTEAQQRRELDDLEAEKKAADNASSENSSATEQERQAKLVPKILKKSHHSGEFPTSITLNFVSDGNAISPRIHCLLPPVAPSQSPHWYRRMLVPCRCSLLRSQSQSVCRARAYWFPRGRRHCMAQAQSPCVGQFDYHCFGILPGWVRLLIS